MVEHAVLANKLTKGIVTMRFGDPVGPIVDRFALLLTTVIPAGEDPSLDQLLNTYESSQVSTTPHCRTSNAHDGIP